MDAENQVDTTAETIEQPVVEKTPQQTEQIEESAQQETQEDDAAAKERDEKGRFKGVQPRIDELTRARREAEREAAYWKQVASSKGESAQAAPVKPTPDQYEDHGEYIEALTDWKAEQAVAKRFEQDSARKVAETRASTFAERQEQARARITDYDAVVGASDTPVKDHVAEVLVDSDMGPELAYHFAKNPDALVKLNGMSPVQAAREIGRIEAGLSSKPAAPVVTKKTTQAPAPAGVGNSQGRSVVPSLANAGMDEYIAQRKAQGARWAR